MSLIDMPATYVAKDYKTSVRASNRCWWCGAELDEDEYQVCKKCDIQIS